MKSDRLRTEAHPLKCDKPNREQFMNITRTVIGAHLAFFIGGKGVGLVVRIHLMYV